MKCLTSHECREWISQHALTEQPYGTKTAPPYYIQFDAPERFSAITAFTNCLAENFWEDGPACISIADWALYEPYEMRMIELFRQAHLENRQLIDAPAHIFVREESNDLIGMFGLTTAFQWTAYLYLPASKITILNWEGVIFDFWSESEEHIVTLLKVLDFFKLRQTKDPASRAKRIP